MSAESLYRDWTPPVDDPDTATIDILHLPKTTPEGVDREALKVLLDDAATRATAALNGAGVSLADPLTDAIRQLATPAGRTRIDHAAEQLEIPVPDLRTLILAYNLNGPGAVRATAPAAPAPGPVLENAVAALRAARSVPANFSAEGNAVTDHTTGVEIRLGPDSRWYPYTLARPGTLGPARGADPDPVVAYQAAVTARRSRR